MLDDLPLRLLAADQHGVVSVEQSIQAGFDRWQRRDLVDGRRWEHSTPSVLRLVGAPATTAQRAMAAVLDAGPSAALSSTSAAAWWGIPGNLLDPLQVVSRRGHVHRPGRATARHEPVLLPPHHVVTLDGVPTVVPARALFEVAGTRRRGAELPWWVERMERMVDTAWSMRLVSGSTLHRMLDELAQRGRPGIRVMRQVLAERGVEHVPPASGLEARVAQLLRKAGLPELRRQVDVGDEGGWIGRVDFRAVDRPLIVEVQSERFHRSLIDAQLDAQRIDRLTRAGFEVVEVTDVEVWHQPDVVVRKVAAGWDRAGRAAA
jgi:very-short-patch-repair endonuclease